VRNGKISFRDPDKWKYPAKLGIRVSQEDIGDTQPGTKEWMNNRQEQNARDPHARLKDMDARHRPGDDFPVDVRLLPLVEKRRR